MTKIVKMEFVCIKTQVTVGNKKVLKIKMIEPKETRRYIQIACALEPLSYKPGCTTRYQDIQPTLKIENFVVAGINISDAFEELAKRIIDDKKRSQNIYYDLCLKAQKDSLKNRGGHRINQGIIEFLFPIVISQLTCQDFNPFSVLKRTINVLKNTKKEDVIYLQKMRNFAALLWRGHHKYFSKVNKIFNNVYEFYLHRIEHGFNDWHYNELVNQYLILTEMLNLYYDKFIKNNKQVEAETHQKSGICDHKNCNINDLSDAMSYVYERIRKKYPTVQTGILADLNACLIYLLLSCNEDFII